MNRMSSCTQPNVKYTVIITVSLLHYLRPNIVNIRNILWKVSRVACSRAVSASRTQALGRDVPVSATTQTTPSSCLWGCPPVCLSGRRWGLSGLGQSPGSFSSERRSPWRRVVSRQVTRTYGVWENSGPKDVTRLYTRREQIPGPRCGYCVTMRCYGNWLHLLTE
jgi:hypothetical protein